MVAFFSRYLLFLRPLKVGLDKRRATGRDIQPATWPAYASCPGTRPSSQATTSTRKRSPLIALPFMVSNLDRTHSTEVLVSTVIAHDSKSQFDRIDL